MKCCVCGKEIERSYAPSYCAGLYCRQCTFDNFDKEEIIELERIQVCNDIKNFVYRNINIEKTNLDKQTINVVTLINFIEQIK